ncbi:archaeosine biosynthesis radical SAM protein RaSEA [Methanothermobacter wolfeii]|uniref:archaeosine biosynthesis radical SAM protein RaSEA n=1 Tax=Methanothermobacter wolfeii TaxID=145261 RepID=UPI0024B3A9C3|nr:archaeosine biosynthesis radical SAM protein RaSEA [Methanothermobacter wolfeii]MDI6703015.1 archaeosine biosynthesis radical SAM protein RaSEA [Methanothermobacter wolfeii]
MMGKLVFRNRKKAIKRMKKRSPEELATAWMQDDLLYSGPGKAIFMILPTIGCSWALSESGGCTMCSYISDSHLEPVGSDKIIEIFEKLISRYDIQEKTAVKIFTSGSFLNPAEFPEDARNHILDHLNTVDGVEEIIFESRPEYVKEEILRECCARAPDKILEVSMGLETLDERTRLIKINKGFSNRDFEDAVKIINRLKDVFMVKSKVYILVKPILTSEKNAIKEAVDTAVYAEKIGVDRVSFCPVTIHRGTLLEDLWRRGAYRPPWIWSLVEIINRTRESVSIPSIMDTSGFGTSRGPFNCKKCNRDLKKLIIRSNLEQVPVPEYECECRARWSAEREFSELTGSVEIRYSEDT